MLDFSWIGPVDLPGARRKQQDSRFMIDSRWKKKYKMKNSSHSGTQTHNPELKSNDLPTELTGLEKLYYLNNLYTYIYFGYK